MHDFVLYGRINKEYNKVHLYFQTWLYFVIFFDKVTFHFLVYNTMNFTMQVIWFTGT